MKMNCDKRRDHQTIKELKAQLNDINETPQSPVKSSILTGFKSKEKRREKHHYISKIFSEYSVTKCLSDKIDFSHKAAK